jgi:hypothetical protein
MKHERQSYSLKKREELLVTVFVVIIFLIIVYLLVIFNLINWAILGLISLSGLGSILGGVLIALLIACVPALVISAILPFTAKERKIRFRCADCGTFLKHSETVCPIGGGSPELARALETGDFSQLKEIVLWRYFLF